MNNNFDINSTKSITAIIIINVIGPAAFIIQPAFVQGVVELLGFNEKQAGYVAASEMWGVAITTAIFMFLTKTVNWRKVITCAVLLMVVGNILSIFFTDFLGFATSRAVVGIGEGVLISLGFTMLSITNNPDRNFGYMIMWLLLFGAVMMFLLPTIFGLVGMSGFLILLTLIICVTLPFIRHLPTSSKEHIHVVDDSITAKTGYRIISVISVLTFFIAIGAIWAYLFLIGIKAGGTEQGVANTLMAAQFIGAAGAFSAAMMADRFGRILPISFSLIGCLAAQFFMMDGNGLAKYIFAVCFFNFCYNMAHPYLYAALSSFDKTGDIIRFAIAGQMLGIAIGPSIAAYIVSPDNFNNVIILSVVFFGLALAFIYPALVDHQKKMTQREAGQNPLNLETVKKPL